MNTKKTPAQILSEAPIERVFQALQKHTSWPVMKEVLIAGDVKPGIGWDDLLARANKRDANGPAIDQMARQLYGEYIGAGSRSIQLYEVDGALVNSLIDYFKTLSPQPSKFTATYPLPLLEADLANAPTDLTLCDIRNLDSGDLQLVFCSARITEDKLLIDHESTPQVANAFNDALTTSVGRRYDRFVAYSFMYQQAFDVLTLRAKLGRVEVALDLPQRGSDFHPQQQSQKLLLAASLLHSDFQQISLFQPINLFSAINNMYTATKGKDVNIVDTGFRTPSGAVSRIKMPSLLIDVREETYHKEGAKAVDNDIRPFGLVTAWQFSFPKGGAKIKLWCTARMAASATPRIGAVEISDCLRDSDVVQAVNKVVSFL